MKNTKVNLLLTLATILIFCNRAFAQAPIVTVGSTGGLAGATVDLPVSLVAGTIPPVNISSLQFDLTLPTSLTYVSASTGPAATAAAKTVSADTATGKLRVLVFGLNQNTIGSGILTVLKITISSTGVSASQLPVTIGGIVAGDKDGNLLATTTGLPGSVLITAPPPPTKFPAPNNVKAKIN